MRAYDYIRELPGGVRFVSRESEMLKFVTCEENPFHHVGRGDLFNVTNGKIEDVTLHFPSSWSKKMLLDKYNVEAPVSLLINAAILSTPRQGDESPPDPAENPRAYNQ